MSRFNSRIAHQETMLALGHIHRLVHSLIKKEDREMSNLADIKAKAASILEKATANTNALAAIKQLVEEDKAQIVQLKADLDAALATGNQADIDEASANLDAGIAAIDAGAAAEAAITGTDQPATDQPV